MKEFSRQLRILRKDRGLTQCELAAQIGIKRSSYSNYETGGKEPSYERLCKLASIFGVTTDYLLCVNNAEIVPIKYGNALSRATQFMELTIKELSSISKAIEKGGENGK